ncbi:T9SS type A sorting domain-containing protein [Siphonobacter aquaeclarae]|jgi:hypothetical protein|uniref:Por secretion system C-terminal sorting domain-containing protein n=1 Tax=Siphonobacter aquaeclarae TaxID=563176 RepID=A0A1G9X3H7_9BACT|nr:T9SS type A sorting domain-containing protein [Siphonobacter aquaeclarae]MBO9638258.1 T9SS type A sorting domain-containing protein [Siphonobacter aquaeclarae]SDM90913.1 Por secretion system C-terminal sorting domain-containing protein [Siphonobacter aquaeclarae]
MKHLLLFLSGLLLLLATVGAEKTLAQGEPKRSRLDIKPKAKSSSHVNSFEYPKTVMSREVKLNRSTAVNEYYRNLLRNRPKTGRADQPIAPAALVSSDSGREPEELNIDKLYNGEKVVVSNLYPNPANDYVYVDYNLAPNAGEAKITFYSPLGMQVGEFVLDRTEKRQRFSTAGLPNNIYFYQLSLEGKTLITKKLLVRHQ